MVLPGSYWRSMVSCRVVSSRGSRDLDKQNINDMRGLGLTIRPESGGPPRSTPDKLISQVVILEMDIQEYLTSLSV